MSPPTRTNLGPIPAANPVSGRTRPHTRKDTQQALDVLVDLGYTVSHAQAWHLVKQWRTWRDNDARAFIADEFRAYMQRRGDLMQIRSKRLPRPLVVKS